MVRRVFIIDSNAQYVSMFEEHNDYTVVGAYDEADLIQFTGGSDVTPSYYGEKAHPTTYNNPARDEEESIIFRQAFLRNTPIAGICRGGQFLHVMNGGKMYQNVDGHCRDHKVLDIQTDRMYTVSSVHHQMMRDAYVEDGSVSKVLAVAENVSGYKECMEGGMVVRKQAKFHSYDLEAIFYPLTRSLCFQPHPEFSGVEECRELYFRYLDDHIFNTE